MDFILNPNVAYLLLVAGLLTGMIAMVSPGSGYLEIGALFALALAGYAVYILSINMWALILLILSVVPFIYAIRRPGRELFLALSLLALVIGSVFLFRNPEGGLSVNPALASVVSILTSGFLWLVIRKTIQAVASIPTHDLGSLVGMIGESKTKIHADGSVQVAGELWSARSDQPISSGTRVRVISRDGFTLNVEKSSNSDKQS